ncbi:MAG TPA: T9SS type A sorting domain-containing protein [Bacteroidia bacterium]|nr:T9SS type A sorting domain-containing protein [Bacteroidia bacterium]
MNKKYNWLIAFIFFTNSLFSQKYEWANSTGGNFLKIDASGNSYIAGVFNGTRDFDPGPGLDTMTSVGTYGDIFFAKYDSSGNHKWAKHIKGAAFALQPTIKTLALDNAGNVFISGEFDYTIDFDPSSAIHNFNPSGGTDIYIAKYDLSGNFVWLKQIGGTGNESGSIYINASNDIYVTGQFNGTVDFDFSASVNNLTSSGTGDIFIAKYDASGNYILAKSMGGASDEAGGTIFTDASDNIYIQGTFFGTSDFDPGPGIVNLTAASFDYFIAKYNASGNYVWAKNWGTVSYSTFIINSIANNAGGNILMTGGFGGTHDFDPGVGIQNLTSTGYLDIFLAEYDFSGNYLSAYKIGSANYSDEGYALTTDVNNNIYLTGYFHEASDFDLGPGYMQLPSSSPGSGYNMDAFIAKYNSAYSLMWIKMLGAGGSSSHYDYGNAIAADMSGNNIYISGFVTNATDFDPGSGTQTFNGNFLTKYSQNLVTSPAYSIMSNVFKNTVCYGTSTVLKPNGGSLGPGAHWQWFSYWNGVYTFLGFGDSIVVTPSPTSFSFWVRAVSPSDTTSYASLGISFWSHQVVNYGPTTFCQGDSVLIGISGTSGTFCNISWKKNGVPITYPWTGYVKESGAYSAVVDHCTCIYNTSSLTVTVNPLPSATITPAGPTTFCSGGSVVLNVPTGTNKTYQWKKGANLISGATLSSYTATTGGNYRVIVTNTVTGCSKTSNSATTVTVNTFPTATITPQGPTTFCAGGSVVLQANTGAGLTYKWKKGSNFISGATLSNYTATIGGNYRVQVTNSNGCSKTSALIAVSVPCKSVGSESESEGESEGESVPITGGSDVKIFPNPNAGEFTIKFSAKPSSPIQIEMTDEIGKVVKKFETNDETVVIKESNLAKGIYCLTVRNEDEVVIKKINVVK